jgi:acyl dehydratase
MMTDARKEVAMPFRGDALGFELGQNEVEVTPRMALAYAAGIGDDGPETLDDASASGIVAPPPYCVSLEWPVVIGGRNRGPFGLQPHESRRGVHASQDSLFHRPIRPGDRLRTAGRLVEVRGTRAGTFTMTKFATVDAASGTPVVTSWSGSMYRGVDLDGEPGQLAPGPAAPQLSDDWAGAQSVQIPVAREAPHVYTECAQIWNPIHTEREVALAAGLPDIILHGTATWALAERELRRAHYPGKPQTLKRLAGRFSAMVIPGTSVTVEHRVLSEGCVMFRVLNAEGDEAISGGFVEFER